MTLRTGLPVALYIFLAVGLEVSAQEAGQPSLEVRPQESSATVGRPYTVHYETTWTGDAAAYAVAPIDLQPVEWASARLAATMTSIEGGVNRVTHAVEWVPSEAGEFMLPPLSLSYYDPADLAPKDGDDKEDGEAAVEVGPVPAAPIATLHADALAITVRPPMALNTVTVVFISVFACAAIFGVVVYRRRRFKLADAMDAGFPLTAPAFVNRAKQHRLDGNYYQFYRELSRAASLVAPSVAAKKLRERLEREAQNVGYTGVQPTDDDLDGALRDMERAMSQDQDGRNAH